ncbi:MAG: NADH oxidase [Flavobacteriales bacterium]|nr:NADH oxidase [Flavobacteriales bacterium]|tara:strand:- start:4658 stop:4948 length:291 start_codon:yes stop_codon:yes gene_type:complete
MNDINILDFLNLDKKKIQVIDVREEYEFEDGHIKSINIPMDQIFESLNKIEKNKKVIIYCNSGRRGAAVVHILRKKFKLNNVYNLEGGFQKYLESK